MPIEFGHSIPTLRIFSEEKAREFYLEFLGSGRGTSSIFE